MRTEEERVSGVEQNERVARKVLDYADGGYMCSESIVMAFTEGLGLDQDMVARLAGGFAGGMAQGRICGAVTGAVMVLGLKFGAGRIRDQYAKDLCFQAVQEFSHRFIMRRQTLECREILSMNRIDMDDPEQMRTLREKGVCEKVIHDAAEILEEILQERAS